MKKILYSNITKVLAVLLFIAFITAGAMAVFRGLTDLFDEDEFVYYFEDSFSESQRLCYLLEAPMNNVYRAYSHFIYSNEYHRSFDPEATLNGKTVDQYISQYLTSQYLDKRINYFVEWNDVIFTNCDAADGDELRDGQYYNYISRDSVGNITRDVMPSSSFGYMDDIFEYDEKSTITISVNIKENYAKECKEAWARQEKIIKQTFVDGLFNIIGAMVCLVYLLCVCGRKSDGEKKIVWIDYVWTEIHLLILVGAVFVVALAVYAIDSCMNNEFPYGLTSLVVCGASILVSSVFLMSVLSIIRNIKNKRFFEASLVFIVLRFVFKWIFRILKWIGNALKSFFSSIRVLCSKKMGLLLIFILFIFSFSLFLLGVLTPVFPIFIFTAILIFLIAAVFIAFRMNDLDEIKKGVFMVRNGNVSYKIPEPRSADMKMLASNINDIAKGLDESVSAKVKAEKMKTELITNVSHDLKTPITAIVNYAELLSNIDGLPEEAKDYVSVISKKSDRLKKLTQDLFDISKVQSGNENVTWEKIDISLLLEQSLGELDADIRSSDIPFCVNAPKDLYILADGRKISRVVGNLINNILKYSLKNTRAFITVFEKQEEVIIEFKNIASYPMEFNAEEIVGRFVRGDESRTAEGNGLGLAIAKSYTELCHGKFEVVIDGDMFKAIIKFRKYMDV